MGLGGFFGWGRRVGGVLTKVSGGGEGLVDDMLELKLVFGGDRLVFGVG